MVAKWPLILFSPSFSNISAEKSFLPPLWREIIKIIVRCQILPTLTTSVATSLGCHLGESIRTFRVQKMRTSFYSSVTIAFASEVIRRLIKYFTV